jgi:hypothetical protein
VVIFQAVVLAVCVVAALVAITAFVRSRDMYERIGRLGSFWLVSEEDQGPPSRREIDEMRAAVSAARRRRQAKMAGGRRDPSQPQQTEQPPRA